MSGIAFHPALVARLIEAFPERIIGIKDSSNDSAYQREVIANHQDLAVFPGSEERLLEGLAYGTAGCISGSVALWAPLAQEVYSKRDPEVGKHLSAQRAQLGSTSLIPHVHARLAAEKKDDAWKRVVPPLIPV